MTAPHRITARSPGDLLAVVPYLLGFHPTESVVALALRGNRVIFQARTDAPVPADVDALARYLARVVARQRPTSAMLVGYGPDQPIAGALAALAGALESAGVPVTEALRVHEGRYRSLLCRDDSCCPPGGVPYDPATSPVTAAAALRGEAPLSDRAALVATLAPVAGPGLEPELARARERLGAPGPGLARRRRAAARAAVREALTRYTAGGRLDDDEVAWLALLIAEEEARDEAWQRMLAVAPRAEHAELWRDVVRRVPERYVPAPATLLALVRWRAGDGVTASIAIDRALAADPGYRMASLVRQALGVAAPPTLFDAPAPRPRRRRGSGAGAGAGHAASKRRAGEVRAG